MRKPKKVDKSKIKIFRVNDYDWVAAENMDVAVEWYEKFTGEERDPNDTPYEVPLTDLAYIDLEHTEQKPYAWFIENKYTKFPCIVVTIED